MRALILATLLLAGCGSVDVETNQAPAPQRVPAPVSVRIPVYPLSVTLQWAPVTENTDGSPITLEGYRLQWGQDPTLLNYSLTLDPSTLVYTMDDLAPGVWYFQIEAFSYDGTEGWISDPSNTVTQTIG